MKIKRGASLAGLHLSMREVLVMADRIWKEHGKELVITCGTDGTHSAGSLHYYGYALDLRSKYFSQATKDQAVAKLGQQLGFDYDVIAHKTHVHVEFQSALKGRFIE